MIGPECCDPPPTFFFLVLSCVPGVNRMTEVTISEQMTRMTRRAIAIPFQFLCGGLLPTSSCRETQSGGEKTWSEILKKINKNKREEHKSYLWDSRKKHI